MGARIRTRRTILARVFVHASGFGMPMPRHVGAMCVAFVFLLWLGEGVLRYPVWRLRRWVSYGWSFGVEVLMVRSKT